MKPVFWMVVSVSFSLWMATATVQAQTVGRGGSFSPPECFGTYGGATGVGGLRGMAVNPNFNPPGSQSTFQQLNPLGSTSPALNLNPRGSLFRPRYGADSSQPFGTSQSLIRYKGHDSVHVPTQAQLERIFRHSLCDLIQLSAEQLEDELVRFGNGSDWKVALQLGQIRKIAARLCLKTQGAGLRAAARAIRFVVLHRRSSNMSASDALRMARSLALGPSAEF